MHHNNNYIPPLQQAAYCAGGIGKDLIYWLITAFFLLFLTLNGNCSQSYILTLFIAGRLFDAITDPLMGLITDLTKSRFGKFKPWIGLGAILSAISTVLLFYVPDLSPDQYRIYAAAMFIIWTVSYTLCDIPYWAMIPSFGSKPHPREQISAWGRLGTLLGGQVIIAIGTYLSRNIPDPVLLTRSFFTLAIACALIFLITQISLIALIPIKQENYQGTPFKARHALKLILCNDELLIIMAVTLLLQTGIGLTHSAIFNFITRSEGLPAGALDSAVIAGACAQALTLLALLPLISLLGRRRLFITGAACMIAGILFLCLLRFENLGLANLTCAYTLFSVGLALCSVLTTIMLADSVDYGEFRTGVRAEALLFAAQTMSVKLGLVIAYLITGFSAAFSKLIALPSGINVPPQFSYRMLLIMAVICCALMLVIYLKSYRLHGAFFKNMLSTLEQIRQTFRGGAGADTTALAMGQTAKAEREQSFTPSYYPDNSTQTYSPVAGDISAGGADSFDAPAPAASLQNIQPFSTHTLVRYALDKSCIVRLKADGLTLPVIVDKLGNLTERLGSISSAALLTAAVLKKHEISSCAIAQGIAIAHARGPFALRPCMALAVLDEPLADLICPDGSSCDVIFLIASPDDGYSHLTLLGRLSLMLNEPGFADKLRKASSRHEIYDRLLQCSLKLTRSIAH